MWAKTKYIGGEMTWYIWPYLISNKDIEIVYRAYSGELKGC